MGLIRILTDRGTEYCGRPETHDYQLYLAINDIEHSRTKANHPQTNGICERFHKTILQEFYQVAFRRKIYRSIEEWQMDLDDWLHSYNHDRTHQGKMMKPVWLISSPSTTMLSGSSTCGISRSQANTNIPDKSQAALITDSSLGLRTPLRIDQ
jgi:hypothetical protein